MKTRSGTIHIPNFKSLTYNRPIENIMPLKDQEMIYPMSQHIGEKCAPIVKIGEKVLDGQKIADSEALISSPIHSSVSGEVIAVSHDEVIIKNDGRFDKVNRPVPGEKLSKEVILEKVREAGVVGMGGAGFPTHIKLNPPADKKIEYIIANGAECEPYVTSDHALMLDQPDKLIEGLKLIMSLYKGAKSFIAVESSSQKIIRLFESKPLSLAGIEVVVLGTKYPQGSERQMVYSCTGREVPVGNLPIDIGCSVINVSTIIAVHDAVFEDKPMTSRIVTISGDAANNPGNYKVLLGTRLRDLLYATGNSPENNSPENNYKSARKVICGGPMMGRAIYDMNTPITKTSSAFLLFSEQELSQEQACIRCGRCVNACPMDLMPLFLNRDVLNNDISQFKKGRGSDCIECGSCSYICPSGCHLVQSIIVGKNMG